MATINPGAQRGGSRGHKDAVIGQQTPLEPKAIWVVRVRMQPIGPGATLRHSTLQSKASGAPGMLSRASQKFEEADPDER